ncbi:hypothetical protein [Staphylospora marina]|uniref:hypothetical protein n=1 Tax=Staphylospora marina TaxID=2490858 RepID=UPI000F5C22CF|nr:hypothetical protein [Staphylospora marina]
MSDGAETGMVMVARVKRSEVGTVYERMSETERSDRMRRTCTLLLSALLTFVLALIPSPGWALDTTEQVRMEAEMGWKGEYKGDFVPVRVKLTNRGEAIKGTVEVPGNVRRDDARTGVTPSLEMELPPGAEKVVTLVIPSKLALPDQPIRFVSDGRVLSSTKLKGNRLWQNDRLIGVVSEDPHAAARLAKHIAEQNSMIHVVPVDVAELPDSGLALSGMDVLVLHRLQRETVSAGQVEAIRQWVCSGGTLLVNGRGGSGAVRGLESMLPAVPAAGTVTVKADSDLARWGALPAGPVTAVDLRVNRPATILAKQGDAVLLAKRSCSHGQVLVTAFDPLDPVLDGWKGTEALWQEELIPGEQPAKDPYNGEFSLFGAPWLLVDAVNRMIDLKLPAVKGLAWIFAGYALVVGPLMFWLLGRAGKREWSWGLVPAVGLLLAGGLYIYGTHLRGAAVALYQFGYVETTGDKEALVRGVTSLISQEPGEYEVALKNGFVWPVDQMGNADMSVKRVSAGRDSKIRFFQVPKWSKRDMYTMSLVNLKGSLEGTVRLKGNEWVGEVVNGTGYRMHEVTVIVPEGVVKIGDLSPGEKKEFRLSIHEKPMMLGMEQYGFDPESPEFQLLMQREVTGSFLKLDGADVLGVIHEPLLDASVKGYPVKRSGRFLVNGVMRAATDETGRLHLAFGTVEPEVIQADSPVIPDFMSPTFRLERDGKMTIEFRTNLPENAQIRKIGFRHSDGWDVYDWNTREWVHTEQAGRRQAETFVRDGIIRLRLKKPAAAGEEVVRPQVEIEGSVKP